MSQDLADPPGSTIRERRGSRSFQPNARAHAARLLALRLLQMQAMDADNSHLRFLNASCVETPAGNLSDTVVVGETDRTLGRLEGIVIDPIARQVRYFVIRSRHWLRRHRYLLAATPLRFETERRALRLVGEPGDLDHLPRVKPDTFSPFSDDDLLKALFRGQAA